MTMYIDRRGWKYRVMSSFAPGCFKARHQKDDHQGMDGWKCMARLPWRKTAEEAQADLDALAAKNGWREWHG